MSDFAYAYFNTELDKLDIPELEGIFEKVQSLLNKKRAEKSDIDEAEVAKINAIYEKIPKEEQLATAKASMLSMWETVKNDAW
jgi:hypothetical protein